MSLGMSGERESPASQGSLYSCHGFWHESGPAAPIPGKLAKGCALFIFLQSLSQKKKEVTLANATERRG
jgi:hypothetical protein